MNHVEHAAALRGEQSVHYNCAQAVLVAYADAMGMTPEQAFKLGAHLGSGMRHGSTCGAVTGALLVLGEMGYGEQEAAALLRQFRERHGSLTCAQLLTQSKERGVARKDHCDALVLEMAGELEQILSDGAERNHQ